LGGFPKYFRNGLEYTDQTLQTHRYLDIMEGQVQVVKNLRHSA